MATLAEWEQRRREASKRLTDLLEKKQRYVDWRAAEERRLAEEAEEEARQAELEARKYGTGAAAGAGYAQGSAIGGPYGGIIGSVLAAIPAEGEEYKARKEAGESTEEAIFNTWINPIEQLKGIGAGFQQAPQLGGVVGKSIEGEKARREKLLEERREQPRDYAFEEMQRRLGYAAGAAPELRPPEEPTAQTGFTPVEPGGFAPPAMPSPGVADVSSYITPEARPISAEQEAAEKMRRMLRKPYA